MKLSFILLLFGMCFSGTVLSQSKTTKLAFYGATASLKKYVALYILNMGNDKKIKTKIRIINNAMEDPRLKGKLKVELIAFGDGVEIFKKSNEYDTLLLAFTDKGVLLAQCENTIRERKISKEELWPFISYVPSGNGEIIIRQYQCWPMVHP